MDVQNAEFTGDLPSVGHRKCEGLMSDPVKRDDQIGIHSRMDRCQIVAVCVNFEGLEMISNPEASTERAPLLQVQWQCTENSVEKILSFTISQVKDDCYSATVVKPELAKLFVNDNLAVQEFARKMYSTYKLRLTTIGYPPFVLTFQQCNIPNIPSISDNKAMLTTFLRQVLHKGETRKTKTTYQISVESSQPDGDYDSCHCFSLQCGDIIRQSVLPTEVEQRFRNIEEKLLDQKQFMDLKNDEQEKQYEDIHANLEKITEILSQRKSGNTQLINVQNHMKQEKHTHENAYSEADGIQTQEEKRAVHSELNQQTEHKGESCKRLKDTEGRVDDMPVNDSLKNIQESMEDNQEENNTKGAWEGTEEPRVSNAEYSRISHSIPSVTSKSRHVGSSGRSGHIFKGINSEDDLYTDAHGEMSPYRGYSYKSSGYSKYYNAAPRTFYSSTNSTDSTYDSYNPYPDIQTENLNFDLQRTNQLYESETDRDSGKPKKEKVWESQSGRQGLKLMIDCMIDNCSSWKRLSQSAEEAILEVETHVQRSDEAMDTVICLDTSGSMAGEPFQQLKRITLEFIGGVESIAAKHDIKENIALVTFGGKAKVIHHLSNDYGSLREALEMVQPRGPGPIVEGLLVSMACLLKGGLLRLESKLKLSPRFVLISDGFPSREIVENAPDSPLLSGQDIQQITNAFDVLSSRQLNDGLPKPVIFVPVGKFANLSCLQTLADHTGGCVTSAESFSQMSKLHYYQRISAEALKHVRATYLGLKVNKTSFRDFLSQHGIINSTDIASVTYLYKINMEKVVIYNGSTYSFVNIHEESELPPLGTRVVRGVDWRWGNQDTEGPGTIFNHCRDNLVWVSWDNGLVNVYRYGHKGKFDIVTVDDQPRLMEGCAPDIGVQVQRGPDWHRRYQEQDCGQGHYGVVIRNNALGNVMVRWQNGEIYDYRYGCFNKYDIVVRDPVASILEMTAKMQVNVAEVTESGGSNEKEEVRNLEWQRKDPVNGWEAYTEENNAKLNRAYTKNPLGSCLIQRNHKSFRVSFKALEERSIEHRSSVPVRKHYLT